VVRLNDRGPFHTGRIIDLSYTAAVKLDIARKGSAMVIVERVFPGDANVARAASENLPTTTPAPTQILAPDISLDANELYLQLAAFSSIENAESFRARVARELDWNREPIQVIRKDNLFRVRMGPYKTRDEADAIAQQVRQTGELSPVIQKP
jgi:rare lipoprotein A